MDGLEAALEKMRAEGLGDAAIATFAHYYRRLERGRDRAAAPSRESSRSIERARRRGRSRRSAGDARAARPAVVIKLNGGLGTSMGMTQAKSLLEVKDGLTLPRHHRRARCSTCASATTRGCRSCS